LENRIKKIIDVLDMNKAENIESFDLQDTEYFVSAVVLATGLGERHNEALLNFMKTALKPEESFVNVEISDGWVVVDLGDILVHIMTDAYRKLYQLESFLDEFGKEKC